MAFAQSKYLSLLTQSRDAAIEKVVDIYQAHLLTRPTVCLVTTPLSPGLHPYMHCSQWLSYKSQSYLCHSQGPMMRYFSISSATLCRVKAFLLRRDTISGGGGPPPPQLQPVQPQSEANRNVMVVVVYTTITYTTCLQEVVRGNSDLAQTCKPSQDIQEKFSIIQVLVFYIRS